MRGLRMTTQEITPRTTSPRFTGRAMPPKEDERVPGYLGCLRPDEVEVLTDPYMELQGPPGDAEVDRCLAFGGIVRFAGEPVVAVAAETREAARDAAEAVVVDFEPLGPVVDAREAVTPGAPLVHAQVGT